MGAVASETPPLPVALAEVKAFLRISVSDEDALLAGLVRAAADLCEAFTGRALIERAVEEMVAASTARIRLNAGPVRSIDGVAAIDEAGEATALAAGNYAAEIDAGGEGWVRLLAAADTQRLRVAYRVGMAADWNGVPEMLRHGVVRLAAQYYLRRGETGEVEVPAAVTALWRPWRRLRLK
ncbi:MAG TPA: head-tail connector protein [Allosphingosinicella sp.]|nr:head-tail connector protein [Allosphingosinicella sp.]